MDDEEPKTPAEAAAERAEAETLARALDAGDGGDAVELLRAAGGRAAPLGAVRARGLARAAVEEVAGGRRAAVRRRRRWGALAAVALLLLLLLPRWLVDGNGGVPARLRAHSAGRLVPGPFPATQTAAARLDLVTTDRLIALRELRARRPDGAHGGPR